MIVLGRGLSSSTAMVSGLAAVLPAVGLVVAAQAARSLPRLLASALGGVTVGLG